MQGVQGGQDVEWEQAKRLLELIEQVTVVVTI